MVLATDFRPVTRGELDDRVVVRYYRPRRTWIPTSKENAADAHPSRQARRRDPLADGPVIVVVEHHERSLNGRHDGERSLLASRTPQRSSQTLGVPEIWRFINLSPRTPTR